MTPEKPKTDIRVFWGVFIAHVAGWGAYLLWLCTH